MNKMKSLIMALSLLGLFSCKAGYTNLDLDQFASKVEAYPPVCLVDVRTPEEFSEGHIMGAVNYDWYDSLFVDNISAAFDKSAPLYVYCRSGKRASEASAALAKAGFEVYNLEGGYISWTEAGKPVTKYEVERFGTASGTPVDIVLIKHGSLAISYDGLSIQVDPVAEHGKSTDYAKEFPKADVILVTHEHGDHLEDATIATLTGENTVLLLNQTSRDRIGRGEAIGNGETRTLCDGKIQLEAVPAYNTTPGRENFHPKGNGNGYVLTIDGLRIYIAGDTEDVPEMADLKDIDVAFLPVNQPYTMTVEQCVAAAKAFKPKVLIPYHFSKTDISTIPGLLPGIDVRLRDMR
ncbi:MAG: MBL fold metallo-hydrolase [Bacteroidales bacterium]|nr:MBL fold metallo-hydrolase [Bacteroidales bacterium]